jgi:hypothetical protein
MNEEYLKHLIGSVLIICIYVFLYFLFVCTQRRKKEGGGGEVEGEDADGERKPFLRYLISKASNIT